MNVYSQLLNELNDREVVRTYNSPVGDYAEWLVAKKLNLVLQGNSKKGSDAIDEFSKIRYQVKSRWERGKPSNQSRELNVIRNYNDNQFDYLIVVIFNSEFGVKVAYQIPHDLIEKYGKWNKHQNGYILTALGAVLIDSETKNITMSLL
jgi:hypothetical protein